MDADQLLLEWATKQIKPWLQQRIDNHNRSKPDSRYWRGADAEAFKMYEMAHVINGAVYEHLLHCTPRVYGIPGHEWECGCYSEYTRDDRWMIHIYVTCTHGVLTQIFEELSPYSMPEIIQQLAESDEGCAYDDPDYGW